MSDPAGFDEPRNPVVHTRHTPWMITFADLLSLMLTFFVLLFSMHAIPTDNWQAVVETMTREFNPARLETVEESADVPVQDPATQTRRGLDLGYLATVLDAQVAGVPSLVRAQIYETRAGLVISLPADDLFEGKTGVYRDNAEAAVQHLARSLLNVRNRILVAAHTDLFDPGRGYASNWDLSMARARKISKALSDAGYRRPISAVGYGASRFETIDDGLTLDRRYALARRIDIVILDEQRNTESYDLF